MAGTGEGGLDQIVSLLEEALLLADRNDEPLIAAFIAQAVALADERRNP